MADAAAAFLRNTSYVTTVHITLQQTPNNRIQAKGKTLPTELKSTPHINIIYLRSMTNREFREYLREKRLAALRADAQAEKKPSASETRNPLNVRRAG